MEPATFPRSCFIVWLIQNILAKKAEAVLPAATTSLVALAECSAHHDWNSHHADMPFGFCKSKLIELCDSPGHLSYANKNDTHSATNV